MHLHEAPDQRQADSEAAPTTSLRLGEHLEDLGELLGRNPDALVAHTDPHLLSLAFGEHPDATVVLAELGGVVQEIGEYLYQSDPIAFDEQRLRREINAETLIAMSNPDLAHLQGRFDDLAEVDLLLVQLNVAAAHARDVEQVLDQTRQVRELAVHHRERTVGGNRIIAPFHEQVDAGAQGRQRIAQLVGQGRQELVLAAIGLPQLLLSSAALGHVDSDTGEGRGDPLIIVLGPPPGENPAHLPVRVNHSVLGLKRLCAGGGGLNVLLHLLAVLRMHAGEEGLQGQLPLLAAKAEESEQVGVGEHSIVTQVPVP